MRMRPFVIAGALALVAAAFAGGWFGSAAITAARQQVPSTPAAPVFSDLGYFYINFGTKRQIAAMRAAVLVAPQAAEELSFAALRDRTLGLLVEAAEKPVSLLLSQTDPGIVPLDPQTEGPGFVTPDLEALTQLISYAAPDWLLQLRLVSAENPPLVQQVDPPQELRPLE